MKPITPRNPPNNPPDPQSGDFISRERAMWEMLNGGQYWDGKATLRDVMESIPAADVTPVRHGTWNRDEDDVFSCSVCGEEFSLIWGTPEACFLICAVPEMNRCSYCPFCGARMDAK